MPWRSGMLPSFDVCGGAGEGQRAIANYRGRGSALPAHKCGGARGVVNLLPVLCGAVPLRELCLGLNARRAGWGDIMPIPFSRLFLFERIVRHEVGKVQVKALDSLQHVGHEHMGNIHVIDNGNAPADGVEASILVINSLTRAELHTKRCMATLVKPRARSDEQKLLEMFLLWVRNLLLPLGDPRPALSPLLPRFANAGTSVYSLQERTSSLKGRWHLDVATDICRSCSGMGHPPLQRRAPLRQKKKASW